MTSDLTGRKSLFRLARSPFGFQLAGSLKSGVLPTHVACARAGSRPRDDSARVQATMIPDFRQFAATPASTASSQGKILMAYPLWRVACRDLTRQRTATRWRRSQSRAKFPPNDCSWDLLEPKLSELQHPYWDVPANNFRRLLIRHKFLGILHADDWCRQIVLKDNKHWRSTNIGGRRSVEGSVNPSPCLLASLTS